MGLSTPRHRSEVLSRSAKVSTRWERFVDRVVSVASPRDALVRAHRRLMQRDADYHDAFHWAMRARGYKAAQNTKNGTPWLNASDRSADSELVGDVAAMRHRHRALARDDGTGAGIFETRKSEVIGSGLRLQVRGEKARADRFEEVWKERRNVLFPGWDLCHGEAQAAIFQARDTDGGVLVVPSVTEPGEPVWFEAIELDRLDTPLDARPVDPRGRIVYGIEKDRWGRVVAYWVNKSHPGETVLSKTVGATPRPATLVKADFTRIEKGRGKFWKRGFTRPGQTLPVPLLHACLQDVHDLDLLILATLKRSQVAACLALFVTSEGSLDELFEATAEDYGYQLEQKLEPGMIWKLYPGEKVEQIIPSLTIPDLMPFAWLLACRIGASIGMSPQAVLRQWGDATYSAARTIELKDRIAYDRERKSVAELLDWQSKTVWIDALLRGDPRMAGETIETVSTTETQWIGDARRWVDPTKEGQATEIELRLGLSTLRDKCLELGVDWQENLRQQAEEAKLRKQLGLPDPFVVSAPSAPTDEDEAEDQDDDDADESAAEAA